jgi:type II secretory pathway component GspD/PulD (secretin)
VKKHFVIGVTAALVIGVAAYVLSQPRKGTVEWHMAKYLAAAKAETPGWRLRSKIAFYRITGRDLRDVTTRSGQLLNLHRQALLGLGYLSQHRVILTNDSPAHAAWAFLDNGGGHHALRQKFVGVWLETNALVLVAPATNITEWESLIRKLDEPSAQ